MKRVYDVIPSWQYDAATDGMVVRKVLVERIGYTHLVEKEIEADMDNASIRHSLGLGINFDNPAVVAI